MKSATIAIFALFVGVCQAQFKPTLQTIEDIADGNLAEAREYLAASKQVPAAGSFLARRSLLRPLVQRAGSSGFEYGNVGEFERKTQAPMVWMRLHPSGLGAAGRAQSYAEYTMDKDA